jgi:hypothetical protein
MTFVVRWLLYAAVVWLACQAFPWSLAAVMVVAGWGLATQRILG